MKSTFDSPKKLSSPFLLPTWPIECFRSTKTNKRFGAVLTGRFQQILVNSFSVKGQPYKITHGKSGKRKCKFRSKFRVVKLQPYNLGVSFEKPLDTSFSQVCYNLLFLFQRTWDTPNANLVCNTTPQFRNN